MFNKKVSLIFVLFLFIIPNIVGFSVTEKNFNEIIDITIQKYQIEHDIIIKNIWTLPKDYNQSRNLKLYFKLIIFGGYYDGNNTLYVQSFFNNGIKNHELGHYIETKTDAFKNVSLEIDKKMQNIPKVKFYLTVNNWYYNDDELLAESRAENFRLFTINPSKYVKKYPEVSQIYLNELGVEKPVFREHEIYEV